jgi:MoaA/NifB/PqqE/SkfB family radical SAM enzyme
MCHTWKNPSKVTEEFNPEILEKIPGGMKRLNITGGEPMLRKDIQEIVRILDKKSERLELSTNGYFYEKIIAIAKEFPQITVRVSLEGLPALNDKLRGLENGFDRGMRCILRLKRLGIRDIGFAMTISGENCKDLIDLYELASVMDVELANAVVHNSFYFHKFDNKIKNVVEFESAMTDFITALLQSKRKSAKKRGKDWLRAYINMGLIKHVRGAERPINCGAGTDTFFVDPYGLILACNGSDNPIVMGDLTNQEFNEIWSSDKAEKAREVVKNCRKNCWMTGTAVPAMKKSPAKPLLWMMRNKLRLMMGQQIEI